MDDNSIMDNRPPIATHKAQDDPSAAITQVDADHNPSSHNAIKKGCYRIRFENHENNEYYVTISLGTPPQDIKIGLDTGSANLWVRSISCKGESCKHRHALYDSSASSTYREDGSRFEIEYGSAENGRVVGHLSYDTMTIGGLSVPGQMFAEATEVTGELYKYTVTDGTLGLGFQKHSVGEVIPPLESMMRQGLLRENVFSVYFGDARREGDDQSELTIGGVNRERYTDELVRLPLWRECEWDVRFDAIAVGQETVKLENMGAAVDTGCAMIMLPTWLADLINTKIGATKKSNGGSVVSCDARASLPDVTFTFGGHSFSIGPDAYLFDYDEDGNCITAFFGQDNDIPGGQFAVIGWVFLREWYSVFDMEGGAISFGRAVQKGVEGS